MTYHIDLIKPVFNKLEVQVPDEIVNFVDTSFTKEDLMDILFCKLSWPMSTITDIFKELDKHGGFENIYGDGI